MSRDHLIQSTITFVKQKLKGAEGGHDWFHTERVYRNAKLINKTEKADALVVELTALLHDIADPKFHNGDETLGPKMASAFLSEQKVNFETIEHVAQIIQNMSFKNSLDLNTSFTSKEFKVVQDADRLDALGAIGIARCFNYGGYKNRTIYDPDISPNLQMNKAEYKASNAPTINHFYEKLLLLKDQMHTKTGRQIAIQRHQFIESYLSQFFAEWYGKV
jgi:uncharacterized protein